MGISQYLKEIGRGREGARALSREQARDLMGQVLDGQCTDLEVGAFCIGMRVKGETPAEMAGFLDAVHERMTRPAAAAPLPVVVLPSYNGARKQPVLTPLLALLLARKGWPVLVHGMATESRRVSTENVFQALGQRAQAATEPIAPGQVHYVPTAALHPGLARLLDARRAIGLRNPAHSLVKLMNPVAGLALVVGSYTHPEYATSMRDTFLLTGQPAMLLRGTEGEPVADARRTPAMELVMNGEAEVVQPAQPGTLTDLPVLPDGIDADSTASYTLAVLMGQVPVPEPIWLQVERISRACKQLQSAGDTSALGELAA
ncbi:DNA-binding protein YbiB [Ottowia sp.]|uniref:DNA-binding protein YbiB n=1 Tax=Ottowia sp. TaxID=1898956 RepID=UPI001E0C2362|nr:DNA-binding protein YbiB [Ottowia sp.]MCP5257525.1 DNA-binding protein YbiB [Burkholderiaceae bacterium]MCB2023998.1 DNA-binding protein YbiB [Ottowia sp.]MCB2035247.1 DNA-binding protein YbiB [Ottowia sp.]HPK32174.1 DNA-binding protein YbiB [Ottowia sp.]HPR42782.1 DNA-binding protein YbiB [Ottowia sp.]